MNHNLMIDRDNYTIRVFEEEGIRVICRVFSHLTYVEHPVCREYQTMSIYVPEAYFHGETIRGWKAETAPVFMPNIIGAYAAALEDEPGRSSRGFNRGDINAAFMALYEGMVVACPGARGRGAVGADGSYQGAAPAGLIDLKAAIRFLRNNAGQIPGDMNRIITNGTSAGGAMSALLAATGDCEDYESDLEALGAAKESDAVFAASCYCPITNLDHADMAYEWLLKDFTQFKSLRMRPENGRVVTEKFVGELSGDQLAAGAELRASFIEYLNSLGLRDEVGTLLCLAEDGTGSFRDYVTSFLKASAQKAVYCGISLEDKPQITLEGDEVTEFDLEKHVKDVGRMKPIPSFDEWGGHSPENELFGSRTEKARHFTAFGAAHDQAGLILAKEDQIRKMNPMYYLDGTRSTRAEHIRIRHGSHDPHTSWAIPTILVTALKNAGADVDYALAWGQPHGGDYDLQELFAWIHRICE